MPEELMIVNETEETLELMPDGAAGAETAGVALEEAAAPVNKPPKPAAYALGEERELRDADMKVFSLSDGMKQAVFYGAPVHTFDEAEQRYVDIDCTLSESEDGRYYVSGRNHFAARFSKDAESAELFEVEKSGHRLALSLQGNARQPVRCIAPKLIETQTIEEETQGKGLRVAFENIVAGADFEYEVSGGGVKENIIIREKSAAYRYSFLIDCGDLELRVSEDEKTLSFLSAETEAEVFRIPAPFMTDAAGERSDGAFYETIRGEDGKISLSVIADSEWINAEERAMPVALDPQVVVSGSSVFTTYSWFNGIMTSSSTHIIGTTGACNGKRVYMQLAFPALPRNPRITKAEIILCQTSGSLQCGGAPKIGLYKVTQPICTGSCTPIYNANLLDYEILKPGAQSYRFDVTAFFDGVLKGDTINYPYPNLVFKMVDENCLCADTAVWCGSSSAVCAPTLAVTYDYSYSVGTSGRVHTHEIGRFGTASIDLQAGSLMFEPEDFSWGGKRMPVSFRHSYNSALSNYQYTANSSIGLNIADFSAMKLGHGWKLNFMQSMANNIYTNASGDESKFAEVREEKYKRTCTLPGGQCCEYYLYVDDSGNTYDIYKKEMYAGDETYLFDSAGRLVRISQKNKDGQIINFNTLTYSSGKLTSVTDGAGRIFALNYGGDGKLNSIVAPDGTVISYTYSGDHLTKIAYPNDRKAVITYSGSSPYLPTEVKLMNHAETVTHYRVTYSYTGDKVYQVKEYGSDGAQGQSATYSYNIAALKTTVTTTEPADGDEPANTISTVYAFDDGGNIASKYLYTMGTAFGAGEGEEGSGINPYIADGASVVSNINNLLRGHNFDSKTNWPNAACNCADFYCYAMSYQNAALFGSNVLYMASYNSAAVEDGVYQTTDTLPTGKYAFSAYVRLPYGSASGDASIARPGVYLKVKTLYGTELAETERVSVDSGEYVRLVAPFELSSACAVQAGIYIDGRAYAYIDGAQLENNVYANAYNMLANGNFEKSMEGWVNTGGGAAAVTDVKFNMLRSMRITGSLSIQRYISQVVKVKTYMDVRETFTLSGWAKGNGIAGRTRDDNDATLFRLRARIQYCDYTFEDYVADFAQATDDWQLASVQFAKQQYKTVMQITVYCEYSNNLGDAWFDDIQLVRENMETGLTAADFAVSEEPVGAQDLSEAEPEETPDFEVRDAYGNPLTETAFKDGEFGAIYRAFAYACEGSSACVGNDLSEETDARGENTLYEVDADTSRTETVTDRCGSKTVYEYDDSGRTTSLTAKNSADATLASVSYGYDAFDQLTSISRGDSMGYALNYNAYHNLQSIGVNGIATPLVQYAYKNGNGRLKQSTYANGDKMLASYNSLGQMIAETWKDGTDVETAKYLYIYDGAGNIVRSVDKYGFKEYTYTYEAGRISRSAENDITLDGDIVTSKTFVCTVFYTYNEDGKVIRKRIKNADGTENTYTYEYPEDGGTVLRLPTGVTAHSKTDHLGRKAFDELQLGTGFLSRQFSYVTGEVTAQHVSAQKLKSSPTTGLVQTISFDDGRTITYGYDEEERIISAVDSIDSATSYEYDAQGQLTRENSFSQNKTLVYAYDNYGNITSKTQYAYTTTIATDDLTSPLDTISYTYGDANWKDKLTAYDGTTVTYDAGGNPLSYRGWTFTWEKGRQLKTAVKGGDSLVFTYNANGIRTSKKVGDVTHTYTLEGAKILREAYGETLDYLYDNEESICGLKYNGTPYYFYKNLQGDIIAIKEAEDNTIVARYSYDAWGVCSIDSDTSGVSIATKNPFRYRGYYLDRETSLYYLQSRYYDPVVARFINADNQLLAGGMNLFAYCENNPVSRSDITGYAWVYDVKTNTIYNTVGYYLLHRGPPPFNCLCWPTTGTTVTSGFGKRKVKGSENHKGIDIAWKGCNGAPVYAALSGKVVDAAPVKYTIEGKKYISERVIIESKLNGDSIITKYYHMIKGSVLVKKGQYVSMGATIAKIGNTGYSLGPHLHFEVWKNGKLTDPQKMIYWFK